MNSTDSTHRHDGQAAGAEITEAPAAGSYFATPKGSVKVTLPPPDSPHDPDDPAELIKTLNEQWNLTEDVPIDLLADQEGMEDLFAESLTDSMVQIMGSLPHTARTIFLLHDAFKVSYTEIARIMQVDEETVREIGEMARQHMHQRPK
jgi:DNA-directed RNA polymerase specialized sigma24 family protein